MNGIYQVSNLGDIKNIKTDKTIKPEITKNGYLRVTLFNKNKVKHILIHRIVAKSFIGINSKKNDLKHLQINHKDGNKTNNNLENLEWCSAKDNTKHSLLKGIRNMKIPYSKYKIVCEKYSNGQTMKDIANEFSVSISRIRDILNECDIEKRKRGKKNVEI